MKNKKYGKFKVLDLFENRPVKNKLSKEKFILNGKYDVYSSDTTNNGVIGKIDKCEFEINKETPIYVIFGDHTRSFNIAKRSFSCMDNVKVLKPIKVMNEEQLLFILTLWKKEIRNLGYARHWSIAKDSIIQLPIKDNIEEKEKYGIEDIDYEYMEERIKELEEERIKELEKYLEVSGLENYELTKEDEEVLGRKVEFKEFKVGEVFDILRTQKVYNANAVKIIDTCQKGYSPYIVRTAFNNGIRGYIKENVKDLNDENTITLAQDTAQFFYQARKYYTGNNVKIMKLRDKQEITENIAQYLISLLYKTFSKFSWGDSFSKENVEKQIIIVPVDKQGQIDYEYMNNYIQAIKKKTIAGVVKYKDQVIEITKKVVAKTNKR